MLISGVIRGRAVAAVVGTAGLLAAGGAGVASADTLPVLPHLHSDVKTSSGSVIHVQPVLAKPVDVDLGQATDVADGLLGGSGLNVDTPEAGLLGIGAGDIDVSVKIRRLDDFEVRFRPTGAYKTKPLKGIFDLVVEIPQWPEGTALGAPLPRKYLFVGLNTRHAGLAQETTVRIRTGVAAQAAGAQDFFVTAGMVKPRGAVVLRGGLFNGEPKKRTDAINVVAGLPGDLQTLDAAVTLPDDDPAKASTKTSVKLVAKTASSKWDTFAWVDDQFSGLKLRSTLRKAPKTMSLSFDEDAEGPTGMKIDYDGDGSLGTVLATFKQYMPDLGGLGGAPPANLSASLLAKDIPDNVTVQDTGEAIDATASAPVGTLVAKFQQNADPKTIPSAKKGESLVVFRKTPTSVVASARVTGLKSIRVKPNPLEVDFKAAKPQRVRFEAKVSDPAQALDITAAGVIDELPSSVVIKQHDGKHHAPSAGMITYQASEPIGYLRAVMRGIPAAKPLDPTQALVEARGVPKAFVIRTGADPTGRIGMTTASKFEELRLHASNGAPAPQLPDDVNSVSYTKDVPANGFSASARLFDFGGVEVFPDPIKVKVSLPGERKTVVAKAFLNDGVAPPITIRGKIFKPQATHEVFIRPSDHKSVVGTSPLWAQFAASGGGYGVDLEFQQPTVAYAKTHIRNAPKHLSVCFDKRPLCSNASNLHEPTEFGVNAMQVFEPLSSFSFSTKVNEGAGAVRIKKLLLCTGEVGRATKKNGNNCLDGMVGSQVEIDDLRFKDVQLSLGSGDLCNDDGSVWQEGIVTLAMHTGKYGLRFKRVSVFSKGPRGGCPLNGPHIYDQSTTLIQSGDKNKHAIINAKNAAFVAQPDPLALWNRAGHLKYDKGTLTCSDVNIRVTFPWEWDLNICGLI